MSVPMRTPERTAAEKEVLRMVVGCRRAVIWLGHEKVE